MISLEMHKRNIRELKYVVVITVLFWYWLSFLSLTNSHGRRRASIFLSIHVNLRLSHRYLSASNISSFFFPVFPFKNIYTYYDVWHNRVKLIILINWYLKSFLNIRTRDVSKFFSHFNNDMF